MAMVKVWPMAAYLKVKFAAWPRVEGHPDGIVPKMTLLCVV